MKTTILKYPFKFQDLVIIEVVRQYVDPNVHVIPVDFSNTNIDTSKADIILGLNKSVSKVMNFKIDNCKSFNNRDLSYFDRLRFECKLPSIHCISIKNSIKSLRSGLLNSKDKENRVGVYSSFDINTILDSYTGYGDDMSLEYGMKSSILGKWVKVIGNSKNNLKFTKIGDSLHEQAIVDEVNKHRRTKEAIKDYTELQEILNDSTSEVLSSAERMSLKLELPKFFASNKKEDKRSNSNLFNFMNIDNYKEWVSIWINSLFQVVKRSLYHSDLWNSCDFSEEGIVINTTGKSIPKWKVFARDEEDVLFFVTPEPGTSNWSIISVYPSKYPLLESDLYYWVHVSKFLAKFDSYDKVEKYLSILSGKYLTDGNNEKSDIDSYDEIRLRKGLQGLGY